MRGRSTFQRTGTITRLLSTSRTTARNQTASAVRGREPWNSSPAPSASNRARFSARSPITTFRSVRPVRAGTHGNPTDRPTKGARFYEPPLFHPDTSGKPPGKPLSGRYILRLHLAQSRRISGLRRSVPQTQTRIALARRAFRVPAERPRKSRPSGGCGIAWGRAPCAF